MDWKRLGYRYLEVELTIEIILNNIDDKQNRVTLINTDH